jgi:sulfoxide reductase heme-binding subunit YedZ
MTLWYLMRASGLVAFALLTVTVALGLTAARRRQRTGTVTTLVHRNASLLAVVFLAIHIVTAVTDHYVTIPLPAIVVPGVSDYRAFWMASGAVAFDLIVALVITSLLRVVFGRRAWRAVHWLAYVAWPAALAHSIGTGTDTGRTWTTAIYVIAASAVLAAAAIRARDPHRPVGAAGYDGRRAGAAALDAPRSPVAARSAVHPNLTGSRP